MCWTSLTRHSSWIHRGVLSEIFSHPFSGSLIAEWNQSQIYLSFTHGNGLLRLCPIMHQHRTKRKAMKILSQTRTLILYTKAEGKEAKGEDFRPSKSPSSSHSASSVTPAGQTELRLTSSSPTTPFCRLTQMSLAHALEGRQAYESPCPLSKIINFLAIFCIS